MGWSSNLFGRCRDYVVEAVTGQGCFIPITLGILVGCNGQSPLTTGLVIDDKVAEPFDSR